MSQDTYRAWYEQIAQTALSRAPAILNDWLPGGTVNRREFVAASIRGGSGNSLRINLDRGVWKDFASGERGGGNLIALYARIRGIDWKDAARELGEQFGIDRPAPVRLIASVWTPITPIPDYAPWNADGTPELPKLPVDDPTAEVKGVWCYFDRDCQQLAWRVRIDTATKPKDVFPLTFCQNRDTGATAWRWKDLAAPRPLYGLELLVLMPDAPVLVTQGEKKSDAARRLLPDWVIVNHPGGDNRVSTKHTDWSPLLNRKCRIVVWPDADESGMRAAAHVADLFGARGEVVQPDKTWRKSWDLADAELEGWTGAKVLTYLEGHVVSGRPKTLERSEVIISGGDIEVKSRAIWTAVQTVNDPPWLVTTATGLTLVDRDVFGRARRHAVTLDLLRYELARHFEFKRYTRDGDLIGTTPEDQLLKNLMVNSRPPVTFMSRLSEVPILATDGKFIASEGFHKESAVYYLPHPDLRDIDLTNEPPGPAEIEGAVALIDDLLADFPFVEDCDKAHAIAFALLPFMRMTIKGRTPLFRFEAPQPGTGKSLLMRLLASLGCSEISDLSPTREEEEWRKRITAALRESPDAFLIDNADTLESTHLKKLLTDDVWQDRQLGSSERVKHPVQCVFGATLNNPIVSPEIMRRSLRVRIDARTERPELRAPSGFRHPSIEEYAAENRGSLVAAFLTVARASSVSDMTALILGGYEGFCRRMFAVLTAAGIKGFLQDRNDEAALTDEGASFAEFVKAWGRKFSTQPVETINLLQNVALDIEGMNIGKSDNERAQVTALGRLLHRYRGVTVGDWKISDPMRGRKTQWRLIALNGHAPEPEQTVSDQEDFSDGDGKW